MPEVSTDNTVYMEFRVRTVLGVAGLIVLSTPHACAGASEFRSDLVLGTAVRVDPQLHTLCVRQANIPGTQATFVRCYATVAAILLPQSIRRARALL
jgi:hypothetical protein